MAGLAYRPEIDGLRAVAVLAVVLYHAEASLLPGGFVGVDVFFVISGYLITSLLLSEWRGQGRIDLANFYARRVRRLMPALWVVIVAVLLGSALLLAPMGVLAYRISDSAIASILFLANFYFEATTGGYFDGPSEQVPFLHLWSLAVEEQFYLIYPAVLWLVLVRAPTLLWRVLAVASALSLLLAEHWLQLDPAKAFYQTPARFWELALGGLVALAATSRLGPRAPGWMAAAGMASILASCLLTQATGHFPGVGAMPSVAGAALVLWAIHDSSRTGPVGWLLRSRPFVLVGLLSYSLYLWHWPLLAFDRVLSLEPSSVPWRLGLCLLALVLAWASYRWVETPFRRTHAIAARRVFMAAALAAGVVLVLAAVVARTNLMPAELAALVEQTRNDRPANMARCHFRLAASVAALPGTDCHSGTGSEPTIAIWGDSHALAWQPLAWELAEARGAVATSFSMDSCPPAIGYVGSRSDYPGHGTNCRKLNELALQELSAGGFETVILSVRWTSWFPAGGDGADHRPGEQRMASAALWGALAASLDQLGDVPEVIVLGPTPEIRGDAAMCIASGRTRECATRRRDFERETRVVRYGLAALTAGRQNVTLVDPSDFFCDQDLCPVVKDGYALFWDDDHVSTRAARAFAAEFMADPSRYTSAAASVPATTTE